MSNNAISFIECQISTISLFNFALSILVGQYILWNSLNMHIIESLKNVASRDKSYHRFEISAKNLVYYIEIEPMFKAFSI